jgi:Na+/proline symporter
MKKAMLAMVLLAGSAFAGPRIAVGIGFGAPARVAVVRPACPGPGYVWVDGYYAPNGIWVAGFWRAPVFGVAVAPHLAPHYFAYDRGRDARRDFRR